ncbi:MAG TPA: hypothetical protein VF761_16680 [Gemmatimonadaceae bacterium]
MAGRSPAPARAREIEPERRRELVEHVRRRAFERIGSDFEITDSRYDELRRRCRERRGRHVGGRGTGEIWRLVVWGGVVLYAIFVRADDELVTLVSEEMFRENWVATYPSNGRSRK